MPAAVVAPDAVATAPAAAVIVLAVGAAYAAVGRSAAGAWEWHMHWDDRENFVANALVRQSDWSSLATPFVTPPGGVATTFHGFELLAEQVRSARLGVNTRDLSFQPIELTPYLSNLCLSRRKIHATRSTVPAVREVHGALAVRES